MEDCVPHTHTHSHTCKYSVQKRERETKPKHSHVQSVEWGTAEGGACNLNLPQAVLYLAGKLGNENCKSAACNSADVTEESPGSAEESRESVLLLTLLDLRLLAVD